MRTALAQLPRTAADHFGYAYERLCPPPGADGRFDPAQRDTWLAACAGVKVHPDYAQFFARVRASFPPGAVREFRTTSRLLAGHGIVSGAEVGVAVHRTWGVPFIPGSSLKGLLANYVDTVYGGNAAQGVAPTGWDAPVRRGGQVEEQAGQFHAALFGAPALPDGTGARRGGVEFHDALLLPGQAEPWAIDVLTPHQEGYYRGVAGAFPTDWDKPNPVGFISVRPRIRFLLAVTADEAWAAWAGRALDLLGEALSAWGAGGKTSAGYGRMVRQEA